jgi:TatD DNase family protein
MQSYLDLHCHQLGEADVEVWKNINLQSSANAFMATDAWNERSGKTTFSAGVHPWYIDAAQPQAQIAKVAILLQHKNCLALGEAGLDKLIQVDYSLQKTIFIEQIELSEYYRKPMILHCVRSFQEILQLKRQFAPKQPWIFHGFNQKETILEQVLDSGCYLSVGAAVLNPKSAISRLLPGIDIDSIFLETDTATASIRAIYKQTMLLKNMKEDALILAIQKNWYKIFGRLE